MPDIVISCEKPMTSDAALSPMQGTSSQTSSNLFYILCINLFTYCVMYSYTLDGLCVEARRQLVRVSPSLHPIVTGY